MREDDVSYFSRRARQEKIAAQRATCEAARSRHDELAMSYRFRAAMLSSGPQSWAETLQQEPATEAA
jgi:hypothetical protein